MYIVVNKCVYMYTLSCKFAYGYELWFISAFPEPSSSPVTQQVLNKCLLDEWVDKNVLTYCICNYVNNAWLEYEKERYSYVKKKVFSTSLYWKNIEECYLEERASEGENIARTIYHVKMVVPGPTSTSTSLSKLHISIAYRCYSLLT